MNQKAAGTILKPPGPAKVRLDHSEWNFENQRSPSDYELQVCCWWEYARESQSLIDRYAASDLLVLLGIFGQKAASLNLLNALFLAKHPVPPVQWDAESSSSFRFRKKCYQDFLHHHPQHDEQPETFPKPWQSLDLNYRLRLCDLFSTRNVYAISQEPLPSLAYFTKQLSEGRSPNNPLMSIRFPDEEIAAFTLRWSKFDNAKIKAALSLWVDRNRPGNIPPPTNNGSGHKPIDWRKKLRDLGIMRLLNHCTVAALPLPAPRGCPEAAKYFARFTDSHWSIARRRALRNFRALLPFLPTEELPTRAETAGGRGKLSPH